MGNKRKRDEVSDSDDSDVFQDPKRKPSIKPQGKNTRNKNSSEEDADDPKILPKVKTIISESESSSDSEELESDQDENETTRKIKNNASRPSRESSNVKGTFFSEELSSDDEVYTFQCPDGFNLKALVNVELDMNENSQIEDKDTGAIFNLKIENNSKSITCALPSRRKEAKLMSLPVNGHIVVLRDIQIPDAKLNFDTNGNIDFPSDLKVRHPLLGLDWKEHIHETNKHINQLNGEDVNDSVEKGEIVNESSDDRKSIKLEKRKKKKAKVKEEVIQEELDTDRTEESTVKIKSSKKKRHHDSDESNFNLKSSKKKKKV